MSDILILIISAFSLFLLSLIIILLIWRSRTYLQAALHDYRNYSQARIRIAIAEYESSDVFPFLTAKLHRLLKQNCVSRPFSALDVLKLQRRFPIEKPIWKRLVNAAPETYQQLLRGRHIEVLLWAKADRKYKRLKLFALHQKPKMDVASPFDFGPSELEPIPVDQIALYGKAISLFALAQIRVPSNRTDRIKTASFRSYAKRVEHLSQYLDETLEASTHKMPRSFQFTLLQLQAWCWFISGASVGEKTRLSRSIRAYEELLKHWPTHLSDFQKGQLLSNFAAAKLCYAQYISGAEGYEQVLEAVTNAQRVFSRIHYPNFWAQLQNLRAEAQLQLSRRLGDTSNLEAAIHTLRTTVRIWNTSEHQVAYGLAQKQIADVLRHLSQSDLGAERLLQSKMAYKSAIKSLSSCPKSRSDLMQIYMEYGQTLIDLGVRKNELSYYQDAINVFRQAYNYYKVRIVPKHHLASCHYHIGRAYYKLFARQQELDPSDIAVETETILKKAHTHLNKSLKLWPQQNVLERIHTLELFAHVVCSSGALGIKKTQRPNYLKQSAAWLETALELSKNLPKHMHQHESQQELHIRLHREYAQILDLLGYQSGSEVYLSQACEQYERALDILKQLEGRQTSVDQSHIHYALAQTLMRSARINVVASNRIASRAIHHFRNALHSLTKDTTPHIWADIKYQLGEAFQLSGTTGDGTPAMHLATEAFQKALTVFGSTQFTSKRAHILAQMGHTFIDISRRDNDKAFLEHAKNAFLESYDLWVSLGLQNKAQDIYNITCKLEMMLLHSPQPTAQVLYYPEVA